MNPPITIAALHHYRLLNILKAVAEMRWREDNPRIRSFYSFNIKLNNSTIKKIYNIQLSINKYIYLIMHSLVLIKYVF